MNKIEMLKEQGELITSERGNSMLPKLASGQKHKLKSCTWEECEIDDIVFCKVTGKLYTHKVYAIDRNRGVQIGNMRGRINGWTKIVYGKVIEIL